MIVLEYKLESCKEPLDDVLVAWGIESRFGNEELGSLELNVKLTSAESQEKQKFYANKDKMDQVEKEWRRTEVLHAAERLGRAKKELSQLVEAIKAGWRRGRRWQCPWSCSEKNSKSMSHQWRNLHQDWTTFSESRSSTTSCLQYCKTLSSLFSDAPVTDYKHVREVIREELGAYPEEIFDEFEMEPIASAYLPRCMWREKRDMARSWRLKFSIGD